MEEIALNKYIDHTLLKPEATEEDIKKLVEEAKQYGFYAVCVNPIYVRLAKELIGEDDIKVATVVGFPLGANTTYVKERETRTAIKDGADEIDMVLNIGLFKSGKWDKVVEDIKAVVEAAEGKHVKVIIETGLLTDDEKVQASVLVAGAGAHFVKTSTGFLGKGATVEDVKLIKKAIGDIVKIKASGGIRTYSQAIELIKAGASRLGTSRSVDIISNPDK